VPEVTFCAPRIASAAASSQHGRVRNFLRALLTPFNLPVLLTWAAVWLALPYDSAHGPLIWAAMIGFLATSLLTNLVEHSVSPRTAAWFAFQALCALTVIWIAPRGGVAPALLVILVSQLALTYSPRTTVVIVIALNLILYLILRRGHVPGAPVVVTVFLGFQAFAALIAHYAKRAERTRDQLALVNADLLATRALLADSARDTERLRVARELHDVAGHKLTAMRLNLRALLSDPVLGERGEIRIAEQLSGELLEDIRNVVSALRDTHGLDLATALRALAAPMPKPRLHLRIDDDVEVRDPAVAETVLRLVQEALTNSARHAQADTLAVQLQCEDDHLLITIEDDGRLRGELREGNGLSGMRERVAAAGGTLTIAPGASGALRLHASLPL
jgi:signal transduction histidine kinase